MGMYRVVIRRDDGRVIRLTVRARDRAEAIGRASATAEDPGRPARGRVVVEAAGR
jgi:hypothetical protein